MQDNPFADLIPQQGAQTPGIIYGRPKQVTPIEAAREQRAVQDQVWQQQAQVRAERAADRADATAARAADADDRRAAIDAKRLAKEDQLTEGQAKDTNFYNALIGAERDWRNVSSNPATRPGTEAPGIAGDAVRGLLPRGWVNSLSSTERQQANQAKENFIRATLRLESGAAIADSEFYRQDQIFFPQTGDSPEVIAQKARARQQAINGFRIASGPGAAKVDNLYGLTTNDRGEVNLGVNEAPPVAPQNQAAGGQVQFAGEGAQMRSGFGRLSDEQFAAFQQAAQSGASAERLAGMVAAFGMPSDAEGMKNLEGIATFYAKPENRNVPLGVDYSRSEVQAVNPGDGAVGAAARGAGNALTLGFLDEAGALADTVTQGGTYSDNLDRRRGQELYDQQNNGGSRLAGQLAGGLLLPSFGANTPRQLATLGGAYGGIYGAGSADGGAGDRLAGSAIGGATGAAGGYALARLGQAAVARLGGGGGGGGNPEGRTLMEAAQRQGVDVLPADVGGPMTRRFTSGAVQTPFASGPVVRAADNMQAQMAARVGQVAAGEGAPLRQEALGELAQGAAQGYIDRTGAAARQAYGAAREMAGDTVLRGERAVANIDQQLAELASTANTDAGLIQGLQRLRADLATPQNPNVVGNLPRAGVAPAFLGNDGKVYVGLSSGNHYTAMTPQLREIGIQGAGFADAKGNFLNREEALRYVRSNGERIKPSENMQGELDALDYREQSRIDSSPKGLEFKDLNIDAIRRLRTSTRAEAATEGLRATDYQRRAKQVLDSLSEDIASQLPPDAARAFREADRAYAERLNTIDDVMQNVIGRGGDRSAEAVANRLIQMGRGDSARLRGFLNAVNSEEAGIIRGSLINEMGRATSGAQNAAGDGFSVQTFLTNWDRMPERTRGLLFRGDSRQVMDDLAQIAEGARASRAYANTSGTAGALNATRTVSEIGRLGSTGAALSSFGASAVLENLTGRLLASQRFAQWLTRAPRNPAQRAAWVNRLSQVASREPAIANDILPLQQALQQALPQVAAESQPQQRRR